MIKQMITTAMIMKGTCSALPNSTDESKYNRFNCVAPPTASHSLFGTRRENETEQSLVYESTRNVAKASMTELRICQFLLNLLMHFLK